MRLFRPRGFYFSDERTSFQVDLSSAYAPGNQLENLGRAFGVLTDEVAYENANFPYYDESNPVFLPSSQAAAFQQANPSARLLSEAGDLPVFTSFGAAFLLPARSADGSELETQRVLSTRPILVSPLTGATQVLTTTPSGELTPTSLSLVANELHNLLLLAASVADHYARPLDILG